MLIWNPFPTCILPPGRHYSEQNYMELCAFPSLKSLIWWLAYCLLASIHTRGHNHWCKQSRVSPISWKQKPINTQCDKIWREAFWEASSYEKWSLREMEIAVLKKREKELPGGFLSPLSNADRMRIQWCEAQQSILPRARPHSTLISTTSLHKGEKEIPVVFKLPNVCWIFIVAQSNTTADTPCKEWLFSKQQRTSRPKKKSK